MKAPIQHLKRDTFGYLLLFSVVCSHFLIQLGRTENMFELLTSGWYYKDMAYVIGMNFVLWTFIYVLFKDTQAKYPMDRALVTGLVRQLCLGVLLPTVLVILAVWGYKRWVWEEDIQQSSFFLYEFYFVVILLLLFNIWLYVLSLWKKAFDDGKQSIQQIAPENGLAIHHQETALTKHQTLLVESAEKVVVLKLSEIALCQMEQNAVYIYTLEGRHYRFSGTLEKLEKQLSPAQFFRVNRQAIVNQDNCLHYVVLRSGKIELTVKVGTTATLTISQKKAGDFKIWVQKTLTSV